MTASFRYLSNIEMPGGVIRYVPLQPPKDGGSVTSSAANWTVNMDALEKTFNSKTRMIVRNSIEFEMKLLTSPI